MRRINLSGADNVRTFVGLENREGLAITNPAYIRSNGLAALTSEDVDVLKAKGLKRVIDLRTDTETVERPNVRIDGVEYIHIPLVNESVAGITHEKSTEAEIEKNKHSYNLADMYEHIVSDEDSINQLARVFDVILSDTDGATLWHCAAGKDRCGIVSALFLKILDVDDETIREDYLLTNLAAQRWADRYYEELVKTTGDVAFAKERSSMYLADMAFMQRALDAIEAKWGSVDEFLEGRLGITAERAAALKAKVLK